MESHTYVPPLNSVYCLIIQKRLPDKVYCTSKEQTSVTIKLKKRSRSTGLDNTDNVVDLVIDPTIRLFLLESVKTNYIDD